MQLFGDCLLLVMAAMLCLPTPRECGLGLGAIREHRRGVLLVCGGPIVLAAIVYPLLPERPFAHAGIGMWTISPLAQDLLFSGFVYGYLRRAFPGRLFGMPIDQALVLSAMCFALWHVPNLGREGMSWGYALFQVLYTGVGALVGGLARQWTGSIWYGLATHVANNAMAVAMS